VRRHKRPLPEVVVSANVAVDVLASLAVRGQHAFTYVDSLGVIERLSVAAVAREAAQWASVIRKHGVQPGDRVIVLAGRDRRWPCALLGVLEAGGVAVPCPASTPGTEIRAIAADAGARLLVSARAHTDLGDLELAVLSGDDVDPRGRPDGVAAHTSRPDDVAVILYAGDAAVLGSSAHGHASLLAQAEADEHWLGVDEGERFWCTVDEGLAASISLFLAVWHKGAEIVIADCELGSKAQLDLLDRFRPAVVWFADVEYELLASAAPPAWAEAISIRRALTSDHPGEGAAAFERVFGAEVAQARASGAIGIPPVQQVTAALVECSEEPPPEVRQTRKETRPAAAEPAANGPPAPPAPKPAGTVPKSEPVLQTVGGSTASAGAGLVRRVVVVVAHAARGLAHAAVALARTLPRAAGRLVRSAVRAVRLLARFVFRTARDLAPRLLRATAALRRLLGLSVHAVRLFGRLVLRAARDLLLLLSRAGTALKRSPAPARHSDDKPETGQAAALLMAWVGTRVEPSDEPGEVGLVDRQADAGTPESNVGLLEPPSPESRSDGIRRRPRAGVALSVAVAAIVSVTVVLVVHGHKGAPSTQQPTTAAALSSAEAAVPVRAAYSNPRAYAAAMTRLSLRSGGTEIDGTPRCKADSTWDRWTCRATGKPTLGAYAGRWLTYRCSPSHVPQPNASSAGLVIGCKPVNPPPLAT
jgi:hypothetical protein